MGGSVVLRRGTFPLRGGGTFEIGGGEVPYFGDLINVIGDCERDDVGFESVDHSASLSARPGVRRRDVDNLPLLFQPMSSELLVELGVQLASRIVRDVGD